MSFPQLPFCALRTRRISKALSGFGLPLISSSSAVDLIREASSSLELRSVESSLIASEIKQSYSTIPIGGIDSQAVVAEVKQAIAYSALDLIGSQLNLNIVEPDIDSDMAIYKGKYNAAGSTFAAGEQSALNILITTLKTTGVWSKIGFLWICPASPSNTASGAVYLKPYSAINSMTLNNFVLGDFSIDGLIGDGSTKYADTNIVSSNLFDTTNMGLGIYSHTASMRVEAEIGSYSSSDGTAFIQISANLSGNSFWISGNDTNGVLTGTDSDNDGSGLYFGNLSGTTATLYRNKTTLLSGSSTGAKNTITNNLYAWGRNLLGSANVLSSRRLSLIIATNKTALSTTERDALYDAYGVYCSSIGRSL